MAHLDKSFTSYKTFLNGADKVWSTDFSALNKSGVSGTAIVAMNTEEDGTRYINVSLSADSMTPGKMHPQHIHGTFDAEGNPTDARTPDIGDDADGDGFIEVLEGVPAYGDILVSLNENGGPPTANRDGEIAYIQSFDIDDPNNLLSPVTGTQYDADDLMPLILREIVLHGQNVSSGLGAGTDGEVNGEQDRYVPILPVAAGEIEATDLETALGILAEQRAAASDVLRLGRGADYVNTGVGDDKVAGGRGNDKIFGAGDNDVLHGNSGNDQLFGGTGRDRLSGNNGDDVLQGGDGRDWLRGGNGDDLLSGGLEADKFVFADRREGSDTITDFEAGVDKLHFRKAAGDLDIVQDAENAVIYYGDSMLTVMSTSVDDLWDMV